MDITTSSGKVVATATKKKPFEYSRRDIRGLVRLLHTQHAAGHVIPLLGFKAHWSRRFFKGRSGRHSAVIVLTRPGTRTRKPDSVVLSTDEATDYIFEWVQAEKPAPTPRLRAA